MQGITLSSKTIQAIMKAKNFMRAKIVVYAAK